MPRRGAVLKGRVRRARWRLRKALANPATTRARKRQARRTVAFWESKLARFRKRRRYRKLSGRLWGGSRQVTNEIIAIVGKRAPVTSRKRTATFGNPTSDHHVSQRTADAVDFGIGNAFALKNEISRKLGGPREIEDYASFFVRRHGRTYRCQPIAGTHGTGEHLHYGVRRT